MQLTLLFLVFSSVYANTDSANATYIPWEDGIWGPYGQFYIFAVQPNTHVTAYYTDTPGTIIQSPTIITNYSLALKGQPIDWVSVSGTTFYRKFFKITSDHPVIWEATNRKRKTDGDYETALISTTGSYKGNEFFTYRDYMTDSDTTASGDTITVINPDATPKTINISKWGGAGYTILSATFTVPGTGAYIYGGTSSLTAGFYMVSCTDGEVLALKGDSSTSDNNNEFEYGADWNNGRKIGSMIYGKFGGMLDRIIITGIRGTSNYTVYTMPFPALMNSVSTWTLFTSGTVVTGQADYLNPALAGGIFRVEVSGTGNEVSAAGGANIAFINASDGDYVPGVNTRTPLDREFYFTMGHQGIALPMNAYFTVICPEAGTQVSVSPAVTTTDGVNPTTAEDMAMSWSPLTFATTYHVTATKPVYCYFGGSLGGERSFSGSSLQVASATPPGTPTTTPVVTFTQTPTVTATSTSTITTSITGTFTDSPTITCTFTQTLTMTMTFSATITCTVSNTGTHTVTSTVTPTFSGTSTLTNSPTFTCTYTATATFSITVTGTASATETVTQTATPSSTITQTRTITMTMTPYPVGTILVYPNPLNISSLSRTKLKFENLPPDARVHIYTLSGEAVAYYAPGSSRFEWNCRNMYGNGVSPGIYYYIIYRDDWKMLLSGKIFLTR